MVQRKLYRSSTDKMIGGVCGGIAEHFSIDPILIRLLLVFITVMSAIFPAVIFYFIAWAIIPQY